MRYIWLTKCCYIVDERRLGYVVSVPFYHNPARVSHDLSARVPEPQMLPARPRLDCACTDAPPFRRRNRQADRPSGLLFPELPAVPLLQHLLCILRVVRIRARTCPPLRRLRLLCRRAVPARHDDGQPALRRRRYRLPFHTLLSRAQLFLPHGSVAPVAHHALRS